MSGHISALKRDSYKRVFRHSKRERNSGAGFRPIFYKQEDFLLSIELYEVNPEYINYLLPYAPHLFHNKQPGQQNNRKYIGVILNVNDMNYFAPLSSFKAKHEKMKNRLDFIKVGNYAVININNMFPVPNGEYIYVDIQKETNHQYKKLLMTEHRIIRKLQDKNKK